MKKSDLPAAAAPGATLPPPSFAALGLAPPLLAAVAELGFDAPSPIQAQAIPALMEGRDVFGQAATGTGKTAAFGLPLLHHLRAGTPSRQPRALVLVPTRELAMQVAAALVSFGTRQAPRVAAVFGGQPIHTQLALLRRGTDVVVATPGRLVDHLERRSVDLSAVAHVVLDEADEMLDMGFAEALETIFAALPERRQTALFSATLPPRLEAIAARQMQEPLHVQVRRPAPEAARPHVTQSAYVVAGHHKPAALARLLQVEAPAAALVFCRTRGDVDTLVERLGAAGLRAEALHGGMSQPLRDRVMQRIRGGQASLLVATDVAARGLDISHLSHVFNYDLPPDADTYVHRIGRTGRAGRAGAAIALVRPAERRNLGRYERAAGSRIAVLPLPDAAALRQTFVARAAAAVQAAAAGDAAAPAGAAALQAEATRLAASLPPAALAQAALLLADNGRLAAATEEIPGGEARPTRPEAGRAGPGGGPGGGPPRGRRGGSWPVASLFVGAGHDAGIRVGDLVGALAGELDLDSRAIGAIHIAERYSLVEVPAEIADEIVEGMRGSLLRGRPVTFRRDREPRQGRR